MANRASLERIMYAIFSFENENQGVTTHLLLLTQKS